MWMGKGAIFFAFVIHNIQIHYYNLCIHDYVQ